MRALLASAIGGCALLALLHSSACRKDEAVEAPMIRIEVYPHEGFTTQTFRFDLGLSESRCGRGDKLFCRWDWDGDGNWDTPFTRMLQYKHRFYAPGTWHPVLEMVNLDGGADTLSLTIPVARGYSAPMPVLKMSPAKGHIYTNFLLDASGTRDDEDSLDQLEFRWDFEGDGQWETLFGDSARIHHVYPEPGNFQPRVQVRDPSGLITGQSFRQAVTLDDPRILATFRTIPDSLTDRKVILMDASASTDSTFPGQPLLFRWDWENDRNWDTDWLKDPVTPHVFMTEYIHFVQLQVKSQRGLVNDTVVRLMVYHSNRNPVPSFKSSSMAGNVKTVFRFDCWETRDPETSPSDLSYRWDWEGDGVWDTDFVKSVITLHSYDRPGEFRTTVQAMDPGGLTDTIGRTILISRGANRTDLLEDSRGVIYETYGTVRIGRQQWLTRNMAVAIPRKVQGTIYGDPGEFGYLYSSGVFKDVCPEGWRVPSREDWEKLFANYSEKELFEALMPGGESDFAATLGGNGFGDGSPTTVYKELGRYGYYWSTTRPLDPSALSVWVVTFDRASRKVLRGYYSADKTWLSIRCVRDE